MDYGKIDKEIDFNLSVVYVWYRQFDKGSKKLTHTI